MYSLPKLEYNEHHAYFGWIPILFYIYMRNCTASLRKTHLGLLCRMGKITLETYLLQHHVWLTSNAKTILTLVPHSRLINFLVVASIYMFVSHRLYKLTMRLRGMILPNKDLRQCMISLCAVSSVILFGVIAALLYRTFELDSFFLVFSTCAVVSVFLVFYVLRRRDSARSDGRVVVIGTAITFILVALAVTIVVISIQKMQHPTISNTLSMMSSNADSGVLSNFDALSKSNVASRRVLSTNTAHPELGALASPIFGAISLCAILIILVTMDNFLGLTSFSFGLFDDAGTFGGSKAVSWEASYGPLHMWLDGFEGNNSIVGNGGKKHDDDDGAVVDHSDTKNNAIGKSKLSDNDDDDDDKA